VFPVRYGPDSYILFRRNSVFKGLIVSAVKASNDAEARLQIRICCRKVGRSAISLSLCWVSTVPSLAPLVWAIGASLSIRDPCPPCVVQWACRHHIGATRRGRTGY
jgi:hypothetical protein